MSEDRFDTLVFEVLKNIQSDIQSVDTKVEAMQQVHIKNTAVLEEHERRSTASEKRIDTLEKQAREDALADAKLKGLIVYGSIILAGISGFVYFLVNLKQLLIFFGH